MSGAIPPAFRLPGAGDWTFAVRTTAASLLALYIGLAAGLERPYWAMATVFIVAHPLTGALRSKSLYRVLGTILGAAASVAIVPNLADAPELLVAAMAAWIGICLYLALLDRTPRSYVFMLAGYSAAIIGLPAVTAPGTVFDTALARVEEITLGIACATVIGSVVFPRPLGAVLGARLDAWLADVRRTGASVLAGGLVPDAARVRRLAGDIAEIDLLASQLGHDASASGGARRWLHTLRQRMAMLLPLISSVVARREAMLREPGGVPPAIATLLEDIAAWLGAAEPDAQAASRLRRAIASVSARVEGNDWPDLLAEGLLRRLRELVDLVADCLVLRRHIGSGATSLAAPLAFRPEGSPAGAADARHRDHAMAIFSGVSAALVVALSCWFWIAAGWDDGAVATEMAAVACCFFAALDDPVPAMRRFGRISAVSVVIVLFYQFAVLPALDGFAMLAVALAPLLIVSGLMMTRPALAMAGTLTGVNVATLLAVQARYSGNFAAVLEGGIALVLGIGAAASIVAVVRSVGSDWSARRLLRAGWREIAVLAASPRGAAEPLSFAGRTMDRLSLIAPRLAVGADRAALDLLAELRLGLNIARLHQYGSRLDAPARALLRPVLDLIAAHFRAAARGSRQGPEPALRAAIDDALGGIAGRAALRGRPALLRALAGIRLALFRDAGPAPRPATSLPEFAA